MLTQKQIEEINEHLEKAQNPIFYYDNDADGFCSFLLLRRHLGRGKGVVIKSYPELNVQYVHRIHEFKSDYVFILDKPVVSEEFFREVDKLQLPVVWIDHHKIDNPKITEKFTNIHFYNPFYNSGKNEGNEPVTYLIHQVVGKKEEMWISLMGCISDCFMPDFAKDFAKEYPDLWKLNIKKPFDAYYKTEIGKMAQSINFGLKDSISNVTAMQNFLIKCRNPREMFLESADNESFRKKYLEIRKKYDAFLEEAKKNIFGKLIFFDYGGDLSISAEIANELFYNYPDKYVAVAFRKGNICNISMRGKNIRHILEKIIVQFEGATGGGHLDAVGSRIKTADLERFKDILSKEILE